MFTIEQQNPKKQRRIQLNQKLKDFLGNNNVYFEPPDSVKMEHPCIVYGLDDIYSISADNKAYSNTRRYQITIIHKDSDSTMSDRMLELFENCSYERRFESDNLIHDVLLLYF